MSSPVIKALCSNKIFFYTCLWLFALVFMGTLTQGDIPFFGYEFKGIGLYASVKKWFSSWFIDFFGIPLLPGGRITMMVVFINLVCKFVFESKWIKQRWGVNIVHLGVIVLLAGGFVTGQGSYEGIMLIPEGGSSNYFSDFHECELAFSQTDKEGKEKVIAVAENKLDAGGTIQLIGGLTGQVKVLSFFENCASVDASKAKNNRGNALNYDLAYKKNNPEAEVNISGLICELSGFSKEIDGRHVFFQTYEHPYVNNKLYENTAFAKREIARMKAGGLSNVTERPFTIEIEGQSWQVSLRKRRYYTPFEVALKDVITVNYPDTDIPKSYESKIDLHHHGIKSSRTIWMNNPVRQDGYTLFQTQVLGVQGEITGLATVKNSAYQVPYYSSIIICIGMLIHLTLTFSKMVSSRLPATGKRKF